MSGKTGCKITLANIWIQVDMVIRIFVAFGTPSQKKVRIFSETLLLCEIFGRLIDLTRYMEN